MKALGVVNDIDLYISVTKTGSFSETARLFGIPPSSVMRRINSLEKELETCLFNRSTKCLVLTEMGLLFLEHAKSISRCIGDARSEIKEHTASTLGVLKVSAPAAFGRRHVAPLLSRILNHHPGLKIDFSLNDKALDPSVDNVDVCIKLGILPDSNLIPTKLADMRRVLCASPDYLRQRGCPQTLEDLYQHACLLHTTCNNFSLTWQFKVEGQLKKFIPNSRLSVNSSELLVDGALQGIGIIHAPTWLVHEQIASGQLVSVLDEYCQADPRQGAIYALRARSNVVPAKTRLFINELKRSIGCTPYWDLPFEKEVSQNIATLHFDSALRASLSRVTTLQDKSQAS
ncbi:LysR family transcriptional regulator [Pseudomonas sp. LD120]|uniref:LysR family transcriptional regulator n=1 Tax=Pseudomonas sp. LD120 TaxID=485751 RepID=UPI00135BF28C|nr:LysR family transcriptional regulator [Pseudomonas sp. LD120]KAF0866411.1 LysR family transcriptional regulator [Pseudomonas sp. LD120]